MEASTGRRSAGEVSKAAKHRYRGVRLTKAGTWVSDIWMPNIGKKIWLGTYQSAEKAARAFDAAAVYLRGTRAGMLNFPESPPNIPQHNQPLTPEQIRAEAARHANRADVAMAATVATRGVAPTPPASADGVASCNGAGDVLDWSLAAAALPSPPPLPPLPRACDTARFVPQADDLMYKIQQLVVPPPVAEKAEDEDDSGEAAFGSILWNF